MKCMRAFGLAVLILIVMMNVIPAFGIVAWNKMATAVPALSMEIEALH